MARAPGRDLATSTPPYKPMPQAAPARDPISRTRSSRRSRAEPRVNTRVEGIEVDFYWPDQDLVVEIDGPGHERPRTQAEDARRDERLQAAGLRSCGYPPAMADPDCLFCKIVAGEIPSTRVDEDERTIAFMDINPATRGHLLVIPREHSAGPARDRRRRTSTPCARTAQKLAARAKERLGADGVNLLNSCGRAAWQTVFHFHVHVIPRYDERPAAAAVGARAGRPRRDRGRRRASSPR